MWSSFDVYSNRRVELGWVSGYYGIYIVVGSYNNKSVVYKMLI